MTDQGLETLLPQCAIAVEELLEKVNELGESVIFLGDGVPVFRKKSQVSVRFPAALRRPIATVRARRRWQCWAWNISVRENA